MGRRGEAAMEEEGGLAPCWGGGASREAGEARRTPRPEVPATVIPGAMVVRGAPVLVASRIIVVAMFGVDCSRLPRG